MELDPQPLPGVSDAALPQTQVEHKVEEMKKYASSRKKRQVSAMSLVHQATTSLAEFSTSSRKENSSSRRSWSKQEGSIRESIREDEVSVRMLPKENFIEKLTGFFGLPKPPPNRPDKQSKIIEDLRAKVDALTEQNERIIKMMRDPPPG